jgi:hypothetical protein
MMMINARLQRRRRHLQPEHLSSMTSSPWASPRDTNHSASVCLEVTQLFTLVPSTDLCVRPTFLHYLLVFDSYMMLHDFHHND